MKICDSLVKVDHGKSWPSFILLHDVSFYFSLHGVALDFVVNVSQTIVDINAKFFKEGSMLGKNILEVHLDAVTEDDRIRNLFKITVTANVKTLVT